MSTAASEPEATAPAPTGDPILETRFLTKQFGGLTAVDSVSFSVPQKAIATIIGPNGAGKTTFFNMLTGLYRPSLGQVIFNGKDVTTKRPDQITALGVARTFQNIRLFGTMSAVENVVVGQHPRLKASVFGSIFRPPWVRKEEKSAEAKARELLDYVGVPTRRHDDAATFLAYGVTEMLEGYGFIAVFVCAVTIRAAERTHGFHRVMHSYVEQLERLMTVVILVLLGGAIARGLLAGIGWTEVLVALAFLLVVRPLAGWIGLARGKTGPRERIAIAFFGIRGIGSLYYLAYALSKGDFNAQAEQLWAFIGLVVAMSIVLHGATTAPVMNRLDRFRERRAVEQHGDEGKAPKTAI